MLCTLKEDVIPEIVGTSVRKEGLVTVFDLEKDAWRNINLTDWNVINAG